MLETDISNVWSALDFGALIAMEDRLSNAHSKLSAGIGLGSDLLEWYRLPTETGERELDAIRAAALKIRRHSGALVVVAPEAMCRGIEGALKFLRGSNYNEGADLKLFFAGSNFSGRAIRDISTYLRDTDFSLLVCAPAEADLETALAFRTFRWMLNRKYGPEKARERIYAVTDPNRGKLHAAVIEEGWTSFSDGAMSDRFALLSPAGLIPLAAFNVDIRALMAGARSAQTVLDDRSMDNPVWLYAGVRTLLLERGRKLEILCSGEPSLAGLANWWQTLFTGCSGDSEDAWYPVFACYPADLAACGSLAQNRKGYAFETALRFEPESQSVGIELDWKNIDDLNFLAGKSFEFVEDAAFEAMLQTHANAGVPVIVIHLGRMDTRTLGQLIYFMQLACALCAYLRGENPFEALQDSDYQAQTMQLLGR